MGSRVLLWQSLRIGWLRRRVHGARHAVAKHLVRKLHVDFAAKRVEGPLLLSSIRLRRLCRLVLQRAVHTFVSAVFIWCNWPGKTPSRTHQTLSRREPARRTRDRVSGATKTAPLAPLILTPFHFTKEGRDG
jgi:hypothetical protein